MQYLIINGSPRMGNTWKVAEAVRDHIATLSPGAGFTELHLSRLELPFCAGCSECFRRGGEHCPHINVMGEAIAMIEAAAGLIFTATTFGMMPNALAKNFLDHLLYLEHRPRFFTKKALVITSTGGVGSGKAAKYIAGMLKAMGFNRCNRLPVISSSWNAYQPGGKALKRQRRVAAAFHGDVASGKLHPPALSILLIYNLFRGMSRAYGPGSEYATADGPHWLDPIRANRVYDPVVPVRNPLKQLFGALFFGIGRLGGKIMTVTYRK